METLVLQETDVLIDDWQRGENVYDGLIYIMFRAENERNVRPLYIGKAETLGKGDGNLSANLVRLKSDRSKFARWGDNYQYHIGDLSAATLKGHNADKVSPKYVKWTERLFTIGSNGQPQQKYDLRFWTKAWKFSDMGIWPEMNPTRLTFLEYLLIGVASGSVAQIG